MKNRGFTLIEVLVTLSLVTFFIAGTAELTCLSLLVKKKADVHSESIRFLTDKLERLKSLSFDHEDLRPGDHSEVLQGQGGSGRFIREWMIEDLTGDMKRIEIRISSGVTGRISATAVLLVSRKLGFGP